MTTSPSKSRRWLLSRAGIVFGCCREALGETAEDARWEAQWLTRAYPQLPAVEVTQEAADGDQPF